MISKIEKLIYNRHLCYLPILCFTIAVSAKLIQLSPTKCLFDSMSQSCIFYQLKPTLIYHPLNLVNLIFLFYNLLYIYYNVFLKQDIVGKTVKKVYRRTQKRYSMGKHQRLSVLMLCYALSLIISYFRFSLVLLGSID